MDKLFKLIAFSLCLVCSVGWLPFTENSDVKAVKSSYFGPQNTVTVGDSFEKAFDSPKWTTEKSPKGEVLVIFTGKISAATDKSQFCLNEINRLHKEKDVKAQYDILKGLIAPGEKPYPDLQKINELWNEVIAKENSTELRISKEKEQAISEMYAKKSEESATINVQIRELDEQAKAIKEQFRQDTVAERRKWMAIENEIKKETMFRDRNRFNAEYQARVNQKVAELEAQKKPISDVVAPIKAEMDEKLAQIEAQKKSIRGNPSRTADYVLKDQIDEEYKAKLSQERAALKPFEQEQRDKIHAVAVKMITDLVPKRGDPVKMTWIKYADPHIKDKFGYSLQTIEMKGEQRLGMFLSFILQ